jgi:asparagine synthetase B (glutamine-hydrolysing)
LADRATRDCLDDVAARARGKRVVVCLSGGLDSSLIAALAAQTIPSLTAVTYTYGDRAGAPSDDAVAAEQLANHLGIAHRVVTATDTQIMGVIPRALRDGQDWRDFNVHCAIVNTLLADAISADSVDGDDIIVLTGDLMNEVFADYTPVQYGGNTYYSLPHLPVDRLRSVLVRGVQVGDREIGVFARKHLTVIQPYADATEHLLKLPTTMSKVEAIRALAGPLLPPYVYDRPKVRAQIGDDTVSRGVLPLLIQRGWDQARLTRTFCELFAVASPTDLARFIRAGTYRYPDAANRSRRP